MNFHLRSVSRPDAAAVASLCGVSGQATRYAPVIERLSYVLPAFVENRRQQKTRSWQAQSAATAVDTGAFVRAAKESRQAWLEDVALTALREAVESFEHPVFPCALIAGDVIILDLLSRLGYLESGRVKVLFIDTFHLFDETHAFLQQMEEKYRFKAVVYRAKGFETLQEYQKVHGSDLMIRDIDQYDLICKVEPFNRGLRELAADVMINGRRQDHGAERAHIEVFEEGSPVKCNPLAWWTFRDVFDYIGSNGLQAHPLHDQGYPSIGDVFSSLPVPRGKWFEYGGERSGRFTGLSNKDGSAKTECGIHTVIGGEGI